MTQRASKHSARSVKTRRPQKTHKDRKTVFYPPHSLLLLALGAAGAAALLLGAVALLGAASADRAYASDTPEDNTAAADAVRAARETVLPDFGGIVREADKDAVLGSFGAGDLDLVQDQTSLYDEGAGELYGPASTRVVGCRKASDPECLAVQVLDKGFPERPAVPDDVLAGRDEVVEGSGGSGGGTPGACHDFVVTTPPTVETEVCRAGGWFEDFACAVGWKATSEQTLTRWACSKMPAAESALVCRISADFTTKPAFEERCFFDPDALASTVTGTESSSASVSATFPADCDETRFTVEELSCDAVLDVKPEASCTMGEVTSGTDTGDSTLFGDECPGGDTLTVEHVCRRETAVSRAVQVSLNSWGSAVSLRNGGAATVAHPTVLACEAQLRVTSIECTGISCIASVTATVYGSGIARGSIAAKLPYKAYGKSSHVEDVWTDECAGLETRSGGRP